MRRDFLLTTASLIVSAAAAHADLITTFSGYQTVDEVGVSGLVSSSAPDTILGLAVGGSTIGNTLPVFGPERVSYPSGIGQVPSPGGSVGMQYDEGVLGVRLFDDHLIFRIATAVDPQTGRYHNGWKTWYGQGDLFIDVQDSTGISHFALLSAWARDGNGHPVEVNQNHYPAAERLHTGGDDEEAGREGHLIRLNGDGEVAMSGGHGAYNGGNAPAGLDLRVFATGGDDLGFANLTHSVVIDSGKTWHIQTWTVPAELLSADVIFDFGLHTAVSCGNDQIGGGFSVPEPSGAALMVGGSLFVFRFRRFD